MRCGREARQVDIERCERGEDMSLDRGTPHRMTFTPCFVFLVGMKSENVHIARKARGNALNDGIAGDYDYLRTSHGH